MSRCFPFPPPGYEKQPRSDHEDLLIKEKHKEKKNKKEKKDKEKREGKERKDRDKDKDHSKDKHREKKDKKDKHRDKDRKKHKDRGKEKKKILNEGKGEEHAVGHNEGNVREGSCEAKHLKGPKFMEELDGRIRDEQSGKGNQAGEKISGRVQRACENMGSTAEKKSTGNQIVASNKMVHCVTIPDQRMGMPSTMEKRGTEDQMLQNSVCEEQRRVNGTDRPMDQGVHNRIEGKGRTKEQEVDVHKDRVREKVHKEKKKERDKEKKKEKEKTREKRENKHREQHKPTDIQEKEQEDSPNVRSSFIPKDNQKSACTDGSLKRKQINGFLHENEMRCNKLSRPASSSKLPLENGRKLDQNLIGGPCASDSHEVVNQVETIIRKENKVNGIIGTWPPSTILGPPLIADATENGESCKRSPHADEKYLSQILHVPKMEEWLDFDDQDWLFSGGNTRQKPKTPHNADESVQVWASALRIETADVLALPFVIPY